MGDVTREEHSDPERRSLAISRLLSMTSSAADFLRGCRLDELTSIFASLVTVLLASSLDL
jgi:hypothetical protein